MAGVGKKSQLEGRQHQAVLLARKPGALPALPKTATAPSLPHKPAQAAKPHALPVKPEPHQRGVEERPQQVAKFSSGKAFSREDTLEWIASTRKQVLAVRADTVKVAAARIAELEAALEMALTRVSFLENENQSLETSVDLAASDNLTLAKRLGESETRGDEARARLHTSEMLRADHDMIVSAAERKIDILQNLIAVKEARLQKLEQAHAKIEQETSGLLETIKARDKALADAERRILALTGLFEKLELSLEGGKSENDNLLRRGPAIKPKPRPVQRTDSPQAAGELRLWRRELDTDEWLLDRPVKQTA